MCQRDASPKIIQKKSMRIALFEPDIPQNTGNIFRLGACLGIPIDIIEPTGFVIDDKRLKRASMDYYDYLDLTKHISWEKFYALFEDQRSKDWNVKFNAKDEAWKLEKIM